MTYIQQKQWLVGKKSTKYQASSTLLCASILSILFVHRLNPLPLRSVRQMYMCLFVIHLLHSCQPLARKRRKLGVECTCTMQSPWGVNPYMQRSSGAAAVTTKIQHIENGMLRMAVVWFFWIFFLPLLSGYNILSHHCSTAQKALTTS